MTQNLVANNYCPKTKPVAKFYYHDDVCELQTAVNYCGKLWNNNDICEWVSLKHFASLKVNLFLDPVLAKLVCREVIESDAFHQGFVTWIFKIWMLKNKLNEYDKFKDKNSSKSNICQLGIKSMSKKRKPERYEIFIKIGLLPPNPLPIEPDVRWYKRFYPLLLEHIQLQVLMAWLSTLGGAYSALGDYFTDHSETAGRISVQQLQVARHLGDQVMVSQCKVFIAMSLVQRGYLKQATKIIREQYSFALSRNSEDLKLVATCKAVWARIQCVKKERLVMKQGLNKDAGRASGCSPYKQR